MPHPTTRGAPAACFAARASLAPPTPRLPTPPRDASRDSTSPCLCRVSIRRNRQDTSKYIRRIRQDTPAKVSIRHYVSVHLENVGRTLHFARAGKHLDSRQSGPRMSVRSTSRHDKSLVFHDADVRPVSIRQHTSAHVSVRQHTSAYVSIRLVSGVC